MFEQGLLLPAEISCLIDSRGSDLPGSASYRSLLPVFATCWVWDLLGSASTIWLDVRPIAAGVRHRRTATYKLWLQAGLRFSPYHVSKSVRHQQHLCHAPPDSSVFIITRFCPPDVHSRDLSKPLHRGQLSETHDDGAPDARCQRPHGRARICPHRYAQGPQASHKASTVHRQRLGLRQFPRRPGLRSRHKSWRHRVPLRPGCFAVHALPSPYRFDRFRHISVLCPPPHKQQPPVIGEGILKLTTHSVTLPHSSRGVRWVPASPKLSTGPGRVNGM